MIAKTHFYARKTDTCNDVAQKLNKTALSLPKSGIREFFALESAREGCLSLSVGEPNFPTPVEFLQGGIDCLQYGKTHYTENCGDINLRFAISKYLQSFIGIEYDATSEIIITNGCSEGIDITMRAICEAGDEIIIPQPNFVCYAPLVQLCGGVPHLLDCKSENGFQIDVNDLENTITDKTKAIVLSYPNNPTGAMLNLETLRKIADIAIKHDLIVISDEIYGELTYEEKFISIASLANMFERTVILSGFSKNFAMTGLRIGYVCAPKQIANVLKTIHQYCAMCASTISQNVALTALNVSFNNGFAQLNAMKEAYATRRRYLYDRLRSLNFSALLPQGAFYVFANVSSTGMDGNAFSRALLQNQNVAVVPGNAFGNNSEDFVRISFASSQNTIERALDRIDNFLDTL